MKPEGGRFDEETYKRAYKFVESGGKSDEAPAPKPAVKAAAKAAVKPRADANYSNEGRGQGRINLPGAERTNEPKSGSDVGSSLKDNLGKALAATGIGAGVALGAKGLYGAYKSAQAARAAKAAAAKPKMTKPMEAPLATNRAAGEASAKKVEDDVSAGLKKAMESKAPAKKASKPSPTGDKLEKDVSARLRKAMKNKDMQTYAKGGMVRGDGICQRGKTKGTMR